MTRLRDTAWTTTLCAGAASLVVGASLVTGFVVDVLGQRDALQAQVGVLQRRQPVVHVTVAPRPNETPSPSPDESTAPPSSPSHGGAVVVAQRAPERPPQPGGSGGGGSSGGGSTPPSDPPSTPPAEGCPRGTLLTVQLGALCASTTLEVRP